MAYYRRRNPKIIAVIVEVVLMIIMAVIILVLDNIGKSVPMYTTLIVYGILLFSFFLTLSLIRYDAMRDIRESDINKDNVPIYTDRTTLICHDLKDDGKKENDK